MPRFLSSDYIFDGLKMHTDSVLALSDKGDVINLVPKSTITNTVEYFRGIICPGFINSHCHLELSHLKEKIPKNIGLPAFIKEVVSKRIASGAEIDKAIELAEKEMLQNGIVAVGDICNSEASFPRKAMSEMEYHSFMEVLSPDPTKADNIFKLGKTLESKMKQMYQHSRVSITPHSPYSVSNQLFNLVNNNCSLEGSLVSIHNQETISEDEMFVSASGAMYNLMNSFGNGIHHFKATGFRSLPSTIVKLPICSNILLVHNTFTTIEDIEIALNHASRIWFCLCPKANLYIENMLPNIDIFTLFSDKIVVGTDSFASNDTLCILEELKIIKINFPHIKTELLLRWATSNAANFFGWAGLGTFQEGACPGVNLISCHENGEIDNFSRVSILS